MMEGVKVTCRTICSHGARNRPGCTSDRSQPVVSRRDHLCQAGVASAALLGLRLGLGGSASAAELPPPPPVGDCIGCFGELDDALNSCSFDAPSCVSTASDDEAHFYAPWAFDVSRAKAVQQLLDLSTGGGGYMDQLSSDPFGVPRGSVASYIVGGVAAVVTGGDLPDKPQQKRSRELVKMDGVLQERHTTERGSEYVRITLGASGSDPAQIIDAEFIFLEGDQIVDVRASSRVQPTATQGSLQLSFESGVLFDQNLARQEMERLRKALRWEIVPVVADFDPRYNKRKPTLAEKLFEPFNPKYSEWEPAPNSYKSGDCENAGCFN